MTRIDRGWLLLLPAVLLALALLVAPGIVNF